MNFIKESADKNPIVDTVFAIVRKAAAAKEQYDAENVVDATLGSLYDESGNLVAMKSVFASFDEVTPKQKAGYAAGFLGNADFRTLCTQWTVGGTNLASSVVVSCATAHHNSVHKLALVELKIACKLKVAKLPSTLVVRY